MSEEDRDFYSAFILIATGIALLLNNFGILPWEFWGVLFHFWPLLIISWGVKLAFGKNSLFYTFSLVLILLAFLYSATIVNKKFDQWVENQIPIWKEIKKKLPEGKIKIQKRKVFRCDPITGECSVYYK